jgi:hypothetical protein
MSAVWCGCGCVGCGLDFWWTLVGGFREFRGCARHKAQRALLFQGGCLFSVEDRVGWRVWRCVGDVVVCIGDVLGYSRGDGDGGRPLVNVDEDGWTSVVHNFESGKACSSGSSKNLNPLLQYIQCSLKNRQEQYHGVSSI